MVMVMVMVVVEGQSNGCVCARVWASQIKRPAKFGRQKLILNPLK